MPAVNDKSASVLIALSCTAWGAVELHKETLAPHEMNAEDGPPPISLDTPDLPNGHIKIDSAEEPHFTGHRSDQGNEPTLVFCIHAGWRNFGHRENRSPTNHPQWDGTMSLCG